jgi:hypothetical protein
MINTVREQECISLKRAGAYLTEVPCFSVSHDFLSSATREGFESFSTGRSGL